MAATHGRRLRLVRRAGVWHFRRRIPHDLVAVLRRREYTRSLRTPMFREARRRAVHLDAQLERIFERARGASDVDTERLIRSLCARYVEELVAVGREERRRAGLDWEDVGSMPLEFQDLMQAETERMFHGDRSSVEEDARKLLAAAGRELEAGEFERLCWELQRARLRAFRICADEWETDFAGRPREGEDSATRREVGSPVPPVAAGKRLSEVIRLFVEDHDGRRWTPKTGGMIKAELSRFLEIVGDKDVAEVSREDVRRYRATLERLPARMGVLYRGRSVAEVLASEPTAGPGLSPASVNKFLSYVHNLFAFAERMEWVSKNPVSSMKLPANRREAKEKRLAFTDEDLAAIFTARYRRETEGRGHHARYWIPLLCLHTGARLEEMAQLLVEDVVEVEGIPAIRITAAGGGGKALKTASSERTVPIHAHLVDLGFLRFVEAARAGGDRRLFPELEKRTNGYGDAVSKAFGRWLREKAKIRDRRKVLHSFRHTVATRLKHAGVQDYTIAELLGHENENITTGRYGKKLDMRALAVAVRLLDFSEALKALSPEPAEPA